MNFFMIYCNLYSKLLRIYQNKVHYVPLRSIHREEYEFQRKSIIQSFKDVPW
jgi:hypothetical protein